MTSNVRRSADGPPRAISRSGTQNPRRRGSAHQSRLIGLAFAAPAMLLVAVFVLYPVLGTVWLSLSEWDGFSPERAFVGLDNYLENFANPIFWGSLARTVIFIAGVFASVVFGFAIALLLWARPRGWVMFRTVYLIPTMMGAAIVGMIWLQLWQPVSGGLAGIGTALGIPFLVSSPLANPSHSIWVLVATQIWMSTGFYTVISLGGLQNVDRSLLDAASVDGAGRWQRIRHVVVPQMRPYLLLMSMLAAIAGLRTFEMVWVMTSGGPGNSTQVLGTYAYTQAFSRNDFGHAAAIACVIVVLALGFTMITGRWSKSGS